jgi:hypothetical protein
MNPACTSTPSLVLEHQLKTKSWLEQTASQNLQEPPIKFNWKILCPSLGGISHHVLNHVQLLQQFGAAVKQAALEAKANAMQKTA